MDWSRVFPEISDPAELDALLERLRTLHTDVAGSETFFPWKQVPEPATSVMFGTVMSRHLHGVLEDASRRLGRMEVVADPDAVLAVLTDCTVQFAAEQGFRPIVDLLAVARTNGELSGTDPHARFRDFAERLDSPEGYARLQRQHPDLLPRVRRLASYRVDAALDVLSATDRSWAAICDALALDPADRIAGLGMGVGDVHARGRQVLVLTTESGRRLVAKPRDIGVEVQYSAFVRRLAGESQGVDLPGPRSYAADGVGWFEHVGDDGSRSPDFFTMVGVHLAALHLLNGTDVHYENLMIDAQGRPVVVDAEALFTPYLPGAGRIDSLLLGVRATGLLTVGDIEGGRGFDYGALDYTPGAASPVRSWTVVDAGRDDMRLEMHRPTVEHPGVLGGSRATAQDARDLLQSYRATMRWVLEHVDDVLQWVRTGFRGRCRYIHRPTLSYALVSRLATHPGFMTEADRALVLGRVAVLSPATPWSMVESEVRQLLDGDIPVFTVDLHERDVLDAAGNPTGAQVREAPIRRVLDGIAGLDEDTVAREVDAVSRTVAQWGTPGPPP